MMEDLFSASQQESLPSKLDIVHIQYLRQSELDWKELFSGFETLRAITYSSSLKFLNEVIDLFQDVEIIFGNELILGTSLQEIIAYQDTAIERVRDYTRKEGYRLLERIDNGTLRLYIAHEQLSHEKLFILERSSGEPRTILGSANFSFAAFSGRQRELISVEETEEGYHCYLKAFEDLKRLSSDRITREQIKVANCGPGIDKIPVLESVVEAGSLVLIADTNREDIRFIQEVHERAKRIRPLFPEASRNSPLRLKPKDVAILKKTAMDEFRKEEQRRQVNPQLVIDPIDRIASFQGIPLELNPTSEEINRDVLLFLDYMDGFDRFHGDTEGMKNRYYEFANWFFASPFMPLMRKLADTHGRSLYPYPVYGLVYGQSKAGKTSFLETLLIMMIGNRTKIIGSDFTRAKIENMKHFACGLPIIVDDMMQKRFADYAVEAVKNDEFGLRENLQYYPSVAISANEDVKAVDKQVLRRTVICHVQAGLTTMESIKSYLVSTVHKKIGTSLYREYLRRMFDAIPGLIASFKSENLETFPDILALSSDILMGIFKETVPEASRGFIRRLTIENYFDEHIAGASIIGRITEDWKQRPRMFRADRRMGRLYYEAEAPYEADRILKQLPENLVATKTGSLVSMDLEQAVKFFGISPRRGLFKWIQR